MTDAQHLMASYVKHCNLLRKTREDLELLKVRKANLERYGATSGSEYLKVVDHVLICEDLEKGNLERAQKVSAQLLPHFDEVLKFVELSTNIWGDEMPYCNSLRMWCLHRDVVLAS